MRIIADEDVEYPIIERLRQDGHLVEAIAEGSSGALDLPILAHATQENVLLLTADLDFGGYIYRDQRQRQMRVSCSIGWMIVTRLRRRLPSSALPLRPALRMISRVTSL